ncbi:hypothetical protein ACFQ3S_15870 [Mucilaginibacter terrae]|uniref:hypothetical protein n=1 Tax=Mucilaginibacter terrae TaxID=1955052 RepID=UPI003640D53E
MKAVKTNWVNLLGIFLTVTSCMTIYNYIDPQASRTIFQAFIASLFLVLGYGMLFWLYLIITLIILDYLLIHKKNQSLKFNLILEWILISSPLIYGIVKYYEWIFLIAIASFLITQLIRERLLKALL